METSGDATPFNDPSLMSMVHFLRTNKDCARLRMRQRWFATKKDAGRKDKDAEAKDSAVKGDIVRKEHEEVAGGDVDDDYDEGGESGSIPMELLEHVKKAVKEFQASMATIGKRSFFFSFSPPLPPSLPPIHAFSLSVFLCRRIQHLTSLLNILYLAEVHDEDSKPEPVKEGTSDFQKRILPWQMLDTLPQVRHPSPHLHFFVFSRFLSF